MFRVTTRIKIEQQPVDEYPLRKKNIEFWFVTSAETSDNWQSMTNTGQIVMPRNLYFYDDTGKKVSLGGSNMNLGGFKFDPLILRGDKVTIECGYKYFDRAGKEITERPQRFVGWISKVSPKVPIVLSIEDNMWQLKQLPAPTKTYSSGTSLETILKDLLKGTNFTVNATTDTTFGEFTVGNETVAQVLQKLKKDYGFRSYFRGDELRCGTLMYLQSETVTHNFIFTGNKGNVIRNSDDLEYQRKDDVVLSAVAHNSIIKNTGKFCKDGTEKTKKERIEVLVTFKNGKRQPDFIVKPGERAPENTEGERREFFFPGAKNATDLGNMAFDELKKYYYEGLKGMFTTFGLPKVKMGDEARIRHKKMPELNGVYKIKDVRTRLGRVGVKQDIFLDYKINGKI